jgi:hypothetical protein
MRHPQRTPSAGRTAKVGRALLALRKSFTRARLADRELMAMRTDLGRHSGWGSSFMM